MSAYAKAVETRLARLCLLDGRPALDFARGAADAEGVWYVAVLDRGQHPETARARHRAWWAQHDAGFSWGKLATAWGRDISTVRDGARRHARACGLVEAA